VCLSFCGSATCATVSSSKYKELCVCLIIIV
jgi:hypothetical protein